MMMQSLKGLDAVYCDVSFFVALFSKKDVKHKRALELFREIKDFFCGCPLACSHFRGT
jgi:predicted nucleic acid-binding protein